MRLRGLLFGWRDWRARGATRGPGGGCRLAGGTPSTPGLLAHPTAPGTPHGAWNPPAPQPAAGQPASPGGAGAALPARPRPAAAAQVNVEHSKMDGRLPMPAASGGVCALKGADFQIVCWGLQQPCGHQQDERACGAAPCKPKTPPRVLPEVPAPCFLLLLRPRFRTSHIIHTYITHIDSTVPPVRAQWSRCDHVHHLGTCRRPVAAACNHLPAEA